MKAVLRTWLTNLTFLSALCMCALPWADGISGTGKISRFGSIVLNGVHYDTEQSLIYLNGEAGSEGDLRVGHQVVIETDGSHDIAVVVNQYDSIRGPIERIHVNDEHTADITVMGQLVSSTLETVVHEITLADLQPGTWIAVGGIRNSQGQIQATAIEPIYSATDAIITGYIEAISENSMRIGGLTIVHSDLEDLVEELELEVGQPVMVRGTYNGSQLEATSISEAALNSATAIEVFVDRMLMERNGNLFIDGYQLQTSANTQYVDGNSGMLTEDTRVEITGTLTPGGILRAHLIEFVGQAEVSVEGQIDTSNLSNGVVRIGDIEAQLDEDVTMQDLRDRFRYFGPESVRDDDDVRATLEKTASGYRVKSLLRHHRLNKRLRAPVQDTNKWFARLSAAGKNIGGLYRADKVEFNGKDTSLFGLLLKVRRGDDVEVSWDRNGRVERIRAFSKDHNQEQDND